MNNGLSNEIESAIITLLAGLNYDLNLDYVIKNKAEYKSHIGYNVRVTTKTDSKVRGQLLEANDDEIVINYFVKEKSERVAKQRSVAYKDIKECRAFEDEQTLLEADKMKAVIDSKVSSFSIIKQMLLKWTSSSDIPSTPVLTKYVTDLVTSGEKALVFLRNALAYEIDYDSLEPHKIHTAAKVKPVILDGIVDLERGIKELKEQLAKEEYNFGDKEFEVGYPERFAKGEFYPRSLYHKDWYDSTMDAINICPFGTKGDIITLDGLKIRLPKQPKDKKEILFHDLPKKDQYWRRQPMPKITPENVESHEAYILEEFRRRREGIWFMNYGKPVYLTGNAYWALQWCKMKDDGGYMAFRYAQLDIFYHLEACIVDPRCLGQLFVKSRRTGFTYIVLAILLNMATSKSNGLFGMTSKTDTDAKYAFGKFAYMFQNLPFFFRPVVKSKEDSEKEIDFARPSNNTKEAKKSRDINTDDYLNTKINYEPTKDDSYDGQKLDGYLGDEAGKWKKPHDYISHLETIAPTMMPQGRVVGKAFIGSTVGAQAKGGSQFQSLHGSSDVTQRDPITQQTTTGLYAYFLDAQSNFERCTDIYGVCWKDTPPKGTLDTKGRPILEGSIAFIMAMEAVKKKAGDKQLNGQYRAYPRTIDHAFRDESTESVFNLTKLYDQKEHNGRQNPELLYTMGNFRWDNGIKDTKVGWYPDPKGRFKVSWLPSAADDTERFQNNYREVNGKFFPMNDWGAFGCDPFSIKSTVGEGSKGAISGKTAPNTEGVPSNKFFLQYVARPQSEEIFFEDVIMACVFYGIPVLVESNRIDLLRYMRNRGYRGFSMNRLDKAPDKLSENEKEYGGQTMSGQDILDSHMNGIGAWIDNHVGVATNDKYRTEGEMGEMPFEETLNDWIAFNPDKRTKFDLTISSGLAIMATQKEKYRGVKKNKRVPEISNFVRKYSNSGNMGSLQQIKRKQ